MSKNAGSFMQVVTPPDVCARHGKNHMAVMLNRKSGGFWAGGVCVKEATEPVYVCTACLEAGAHAWARLPTEVEDRLAQIRAQVQKGLEASMNASDLLCLLDEALRVRASGVALNGQEVHDVSVASKSVAERHRENMEALQGGLLAAVGKVTRVHVICPACKDGQFDVNVDRTAGKKTEAACPLCLTKCWLYVENGCVQISVE